MADLQTQVSDALAQMRPYLERSGVRVELVGIEDGVAHVEVLRDTPGFMLTNAAFVAGIERALREKVPGLRGVAAINLPPYTVIGWDKPEFQQRRARVPSDPTKPTSS